MDKQEILEKLKRTNQGLSYGQLEGLLYILSGRVDCDDAGIIRKTGLPKETVKIFRRSVSPFEENLPEFGKFEFKPYLWSFSDASIIEEAAVEKFSQFREEYKKKASRELDQFYALPETSIKKAKLMIEKGEVSGKNVAILGDDDLISLALIILEGRFKSLTVFDVDKELLAFIRDKIDQMGIEGVQIEHYDCRKELRNGFSGRFDTVITDPPYTRYGAELFLERALELVGGGKLPGKRIFFFYGNSIHSPEKFLKIQEILTRFNVVIEDKVSNFAHYSGAESIGSASSLYILKTLPSTALHEGLIANRKIYTYEAEKEERFPFVDHVVLKVTRVPLQILHSKGKMLALLDAFCKQHRLKVVDTKVTEFKGKGFTFVFVLSNSNLTVHTWPEHNAVHFDLITCSPIYDKLSLPKNVSELFGTDSIDINYVE